MIAIRRKLRRLLRSKRGATAIEYGLIAALVVIAMIGDAELADRAAHNVDRGGGITFFGAANFNH